MRLRQSQVERIRQIVAAEAGDDVSARVFGSRLDDQARGGDLDLFLTFPEAVPHPAQLSARLATRISRALDGRSVDIVIEAPNLVHQPIHDVARQQGVRIV